VLGINRACPIIKPLQTAEEIEITPTRNHEEPFTCTKYSKDHLIGFQERMSRGEDPFLPAPYLPLRLSKLYPLMKFRDILLILGEMTLAIASTLFKQF
jgi:hypothetical protein